MRAGPLLLRGCGLQVYTASHVSAFVSTLFRLGGRTGYWVHSFIIEIDKGTKTVAEEWGVSWGGGKSSAAVSDISCEQRAALLGEEAVDTDPPVFTLAHPDAGTHFVVPYGVAWDKPFTLDPCTSDLDTDPTCFLSAFDEGDEEDVSKFIRVEQDLSGCDGLSCTCSLATAMAGQCFPHVYQYTYTVGDLAGNAATQHIEVAVVMQGAVDLEMAITVDTEEEAEALAEQVCFLRGRYEPFVIP